ncbi:MAG: hypothetical protein H0U99_02830 [Chthoniobacterales bacterium]|nr:hypothetical protein [Chthoniobacterales bacterium]
MHLNDPAAQLADALRERRAIIADEESRRRPEQHMARLQAASERIGELRTRLPEPVHPQLAHYLARASYDKALAFLENGMA